MNIIEREGYVENSAVQGEYLINKMQDLYKYSIVGDIRGKGLMIGLEFVKDKVTKEPFDTKVKLNSKITNHCLDAGIVPYPGGGSVDGVRGDHILITPPINITKEEVDILYKMLPSNFKSLYPRSSYTINACLYLCKATSYNNLDTYIFPSTIYAFNYNKGEGYNSIFTGIDYFLLQNFYPYNFSIAQFNL